MVPNTRFPVISILAADSANFGRFFGAQPAISHLRAAEIACSAQSV
jgi:hypothetical protein